MKNPPANVGDVSSVPGLERSRGEGNGNPLQYSCLGNPMDRGAWWATVHGIVRVRHDLTVEQPENTRIFVNQPKMPTVSLENLMK